EALPDAMARQFHACTHTTMAPTIIHGGSKTNTIPDLVELELDVRTLPGQTDDDVLAILHDALGDLAPSVEIIPIVSDGSTAPPGPPRRWGTRSPGPQSRGTRPPAPSRSSRWGRPTRGSSVGSTAPPTGSACSASGSASRTTARCSTATTSGSTSSRSCCR